MLSASLDEAFLIARSITSLGIDSALGGGDRQPQARIGVDVRQALLGGQGDVPRQLGEQLGLRLILAALAVHDVLEFRMSGHVRALGASASVNRVRGF